MLLGLVCLFYLINVFSILLFSLLLSFASLVGCVRLLFFAFQVLQDVFLKFRFFLLFEIVFKFLDSQTCFPSKATSENVRFPPFSSIFVLYFPFSTVRFPLATLALLTCSICSLRRDTNPWPYSMSIVYRTFVCLHKNLARNRFIRVSVKFEFPGRTPRTACRSNCSTGLSGFLPRRKLTGWVRINIQEHNEENIDRCLRNGISSRLIYS